MVVLLFREGFMSKKSHLSTLVELGTVKSSSFEKRHSKAGYTPWLFEKQIPLEKRGKGHFFLTKCEKYVLLL